MAKLPTVWHLISNRWNSAITEYALSAARATQLLGAHTVFTPLMSSPAESRAKKHDLLVRSLPQFSLRQWFHFRRIAKQIKPDLVITYGGPESFLVRFLSDSQPKYWRFRGHDLVPSHGSKINLLKTKFSHQVFDRIIAPSQFMATNFPVTSPPISVVPLGCDLHRFHRTPQQGKVRNMEMLVLGRLDPIKGHREFFPILKKIIQLWQLESPQLPHPYLHIVGEPANLSTDELCQIAHQQGLREGVDIVLEGKRLPKVADLMSRAVMGVIPSLGSEVICRVGEEFLLCGTPVAVSGVGSLQELLFNKAAGVSYRDLSIDDSAKIIFKFLMRSFHETEEEKKARAREAIDHYSLLRMSQNIEALMRLDLVY